MGYSLGVDLGTATVAAVVARAEQVEPLQLEHASPLAPASLAWDGQLLVGDAAEQAAGRGTAQPLRGIIRRVGDPTTLSLGGAPHSVESLLAYLLGHVLRCATQREAAAPGPVVLTHPASWGPYRQQSLVEAAKLAGIAVPHLVSDAEAAARHHLSRHPVPDGTIIAVYDLGGGRFDATLVRVTRDGLEPVGAAEGLENVGGLDFDNLLFDHIRAGLGADLDGLDLADPEAAATLERLRRYCRQAKERLSEHDQVVLGLTMAGQPRGLAIERATFEDLVRDSVTAAVDSFTG
jgi:molecular chaperone DnaK (HSP70)